MLEEVHPILEYVKHVDLDIQYLVDLDYILPVPTKSGYGDDAPVLWVQKLTYFVVSLLL